MNSNRDMANAFNDFFTKVGQNLDNDIPKKPRGPSLTGYQNHFLLVPLLLMKLGKL